MIYAIGDIHGELQKLRNLMEKIEATGLTESDRLVFVGDYIDRGPCVPQVLEYLVELKERRPGDIFLRGNHDQVMLEARDYFDKSRGVSVRFDDIQWWFSCGGRETIEQYPKTKPWYTAIPASHWEFLESTRMQYEEGNYLFVHAGMVPPGKKWRQKEDPRLWIREEFIGSKADFGKTVVFGHTPQDLMMPCVMKNKVGVDTGAAYGGPLTALRLDPQAKYDMDHLQFLYAN
jgi:serine/threonine protein phosphatase 1